jgi:uncharacterized membrane protein
VIVGASNSELGWQAFRWTRETGMVGLGFLPYGFPNTTPRAVSADGSIIVGDGSGATGTEAFAWDEAHGVRAISAMLRPAVAAALDGWSLDSCEAISADGLTVVGWGTNPSGNHEAWVAYLGGDVPEPASWTLLEFGLSLLLARHRASLKRRPDSAWRPRPRIRALTHFEVQILPR